MKPMQELINELVAEGYLATPAIIKAFREVKRRDFLPPELIDEEGFNSPLPIGHGQTNSQPLTVAYMLELLAPQEGDTVLDIGAGSGWTTALLAHIVGPTGKVYAIERLSALKTFGERNVHSGGFKNVEFFCRDGAKGLPSHAPFDRIHVAAAAYEVPEELKNQLKSGGRLVIPTVAEDIKVFEKLTDGTFRQDSYPGFLFVPLIEE